jgi:hypothetical protein
MRRATLIPLALLGLAATLTCSVSRWALPLNAQTAFQLTVTQSDARRKISVNSDLIVLPVTVKDQNGNLVAGLERKDVRVFDDGSEQVIDVFTSEASPLSLVLLIDDDLKAKDAAQMAPSLRAIAAGISSADEKRWSAVLTSCFIQEKFLLAMATGFSRT